MEKPQDVWSNQEIECPWCKKPQSDSWEHGDDGTIECGWCERPFHYSRHLSVSYESWVDNEQVKAVLSESAEPKRGES